MPIYSKQTGLHLYLIGKVQCYWDVVETDLAAVCALDPRCKDAEAALIAFYAQNAVEKKLSLVEQAATGLPSWPSLQAHWRTARPAIAEAARRRNALVHHHRAFLVGIGAENAVVQFNPKVTPQPSDFLAAKTLALEDALKVWDHVIFAANIATNFLWLCRTGEPAFPRAVSHVGQVTPLTREELEQELRAMLDADK